MAKTAVRKRTEAEQAKTREQELLQIQERLKDALGRIYLAHASIRSTPNMLSWLEVKRLMDGSPLEADDWSRSLGIRTYTFTTRLKKRKSFNALESERLALVAQVMARGQEVFGDPGKLERWLDRPHMYMDNRKPKELLGSAAGIGLILAEFDRIEAGAFA